MDRLPSFKSFANSSLTAAMANFTTGHDHTFAANCSSEDTASNDYTGSATGNVHHHQAASSCPPYSNPQEQEHSDGGHHLETEDQEQPNQVEEVQPPTNNSTSSDNLTHQQQSKNSILTIAEGDDDEDMDACHGAPNNLLEPEVDLIEEQSSDAHPFNCGSSPEQSFHQKHRSAIKQPNVLRRVSGSSQQASSATSNQSNHHHRTGSASGCSGGGGSGVGLSALGHGGHQQGCSSENGTGGGILKSTLERGLKDCDDLNEPDDEIFDSFADERRGCRSLICDTNGIIVAEMVYRCIICAFITESIADAQVHYHRRHMRKSQSLMTNTSTTKSGERCSNATGKSRSCSARSKSTINSNSNYINQQNMSQQTIYSSSPDVSHPTSPIGGNSPSLHMDEMMDMETDDLDNFSEPDTGISGQHSNSLDPFSNDPKPKGKFVFSPSPADYVPGRNAIIKQNGSGSIGACHPTPGPTSVRGGYVTCAVCSITKYYASVQRRYGQFTCMGCAKFFGRFLIKPRRYYCTSLGSCPLDLSPRCKACLLLACINTYNIDDKRMRIVNANRPLNKSNNSSNRSSNECASGTPNGGGNSSTGGGTSVLSSSSSNQVNNSSLSFAPPPLVGKSQINSSIVNERNQTSSGAGGDSSGNTGNSGGSTRGSALPLTTRSTGNNSSTVTTVGRKGTGCRQCSNCLADDCGKCNYCLDKPKFGGPNTLKKKCIQKKCLLIQPNTGVRVRSTGPASGLKDNNSISNTKSYVSHVR